MKKKTEIVLGTNIRLDVEKPKDGALDLSSVNIACEVGTVIGFGEGVTLPIAVGDRVVFKSWAVDIADVDGEKRYYIDEKTGGIKEIL